MPYVPHLWWSKVWQWDRERSRWRWLGVRSTTLASHLGCCCVHVMFIECMTGMLSMYCDVCSSLCTHFAVVISMNKLMKLFLKLSKYCTVGKYCRWVVSSSTHLAYTMTYRWVDFGQNVVTCMKMYVWWQQRHACDGNYIITLVLTKQSKDKDHEQQ